MLTLITSLFLSLGHTTCEHNSSLAPHNYSFSPLGQFDNGYPEEKYNSIIQIFKDIYSPIIEDLGGQFMILDDWTDGAVNMWAFRNGKEYWLEVPGGMSRYYLINEEAFILSICHELGHLLGGAPQRGVISLEGQSDYYAGLECVEKMFPSINPIKELKPTEEVTQACQLLDSPELETCHRNLMGALSLTSYYAELENVDFPKLSTPSKDKVSETLQDHPPAQCRLDTFYAGYFKSKRPQCWYKAP